MDGADIIIIIVFIVISILSSVIKAFNKKTKKRMAQESHLPERSDPWDMIFPATVDPQNNPEPEPAYEYRDYSHESEENEIYRPISPISQSRLKESNPKKTRIEAATMEPQIRDMDGSDYSKIMEDFDLQTAVIYSEILKPKFEED